MMKCKKNKEKIIFVFLFIFLVSISYFSAEEIKLNYSSSSIVQIKQLKYEPYPVNPGEYFNLWLSAQIAGNNPSEDVIFELQPEFPFSLDNNEESVRNFGKLSSPSVVINYKIRVDKDAIKGINELKLKYKVGNNWYTQTFDINVEGSQTNFDAVIQEVSGSDVSIAIANTGKYTANSVIIKIPKQEDFRATETDGQMVGNLESGDYTIVSFSIASITQRNASYSQNTAKTNQMQQVQNTEKNLKFDIYYTDAIGERRTVNMELPLRITNSTTGSFSRTNSKTTTNSLFSNYYFWLVVLLIIIVLVIVYRKSLKKLLKNNNPKKEDSIPTWMKNMKEKPK